MVIDEKDMAVELKESLKDIIACVDQLHIYTDDANTYDDLASAMKIYRDYISKLERADKITNLYVKYIDKNINCQKIRDAIDNAKGNLERNIDLLIRGEMDAIFKFGTLELGESRDLFYS